MMNPIAEEKMIETERPLKEDPGGSLLPPQFAQELHGRWDRIQTGFLDEPRAAVQQADELVNDAIQPLTEGFAEARAGLERQWDRGTEVSTEDLRIVLQKYRSFFQRLLAISCCVRPFLAAQLQLVPPEPSD